jgi:hypothetical protein
VNVHRIFHAAAAALLLVTGGCSADRLSEDAPPAAHASALAVVVVTPSAATVDFQLPERETWHWNAADTPRDWTEYEWQVYVGDEEGPRHTLGFLLFRHSDAVPAAGTTAQLIEAGQADLWTVDASGGRRHPAAVDAEFAEGRLRVRLRDQRAVQEVFGSRPATVTLNVRIPGEPAHRSRVPVRYQGL